jgi:aminocarboxymuconate-semialdehyde decarboxylase
VGGDIDGLHRCSHHVVPLGTRTARSRHRTIDVHCHAFAAAAEALVADHPARRNAAAAEAAALGPASQAVNAERAAALAPRLTGVDERLRDMDAMGVDIQLISPSPTQYHYWADPALAARLTGTINDHIAGLCAAHPDRLLGLGTLALQHPEAAAHQLEALMRGDHGFKGVEISSLVDGVDVADRRFDPFWAKADELGAIVFIHPWGTSLGTRLSEHYLMNTVGQPFETTVCLSKLIFGGTLDRHPGLKLIAAHGGGYLPLVSGRSDHAHVARPEAGGCACLPSSYLRRIWFDSVVHGPRHLERLADEVGVDRILVGTDYPFDMGHYDPTSLVAGFDDEDQQRILGGNAARLLGLDPV